MKRQTVALSQSKYAKRVGVSQPYISKLVKKGILPVGADGKLNPEECDRAMEASVIPWQRMRKENTLQSRTTNAAPVCMGCGMSYRLQDAKAFGCLDPLKFCDEYCRLDFAEGYTPEEIRARHELEDATTCKGHLAARGGERITTNSKCKECCGTGFKPDTPGTHVLCACAKVTALDSERRV